MARKSFDPSRSAGHGVLLMKGFAWDGDLEAPHYRRERSEGVTCVSRDFRGGWSFVVRATASDDTLCVVSLHFDSMLALARAINA